MCTLTFIPLTKGSVITANRDESPKRNAHILNPYFSALDEQYLIAEEPLRGGTNIAIGQKSRTAVLLNGAFERHDMNKNYGLSRGIVVLKSLDEKDLFAFADDFDFENIEPFTLFHFGEAIREIRWDGKKIYKREYEGNEPGIWSSAQLYLPEIREKREELFTTFLKSNSITPQTISQFHFNGGTGDSANDLVMNRNRLVETVSITQVVTHKEDKKIKHWDLVENTEMDYTFDSE